MPFWTLRRKLTAAGVVILLLVLGWASIVVAVALAGAHDEARSADAITVLVFWFKGQMHLPNMRPGQQNPFGTEITGVGQMIQLAVWGMCLTVAILMTVGGIVGTDLERGYY